MPPEININELYGARRKKEMIRTVAFDHIIGMCHRRVRLVAGNGGQNTFYHIPGFLIGFPLYVLSECVDYVVNALRGNGFLVQILPPPHVSVVYVSWDPQELRPQTMRAITQQNTRVPAINGPMLRQKSTMPKLF